jgi:hypothetical protein
MRAAPERDGPMHPQLFGEQSLVTGRGCNSGRTHALVTAPDMTSAIAACHSAQAPVYSDFCYVIDSDGGTSQDSAECSSANASWRANGCCNFKGTLSCPG